MLAKMTKKRLTLLILLLVFSITACRIKACDKPPAPPPTPVPNMFDKCSPNKVCNVVLWYTFGNQATENYYQALSKQYSQLPKHQNVQVSVLNKVGYTNYLAQLREKRGTSEAPDVYLVRNDWLNKFEKEKIIPITDVALRNATTGTADVYNNIYELADLFLPSLKEDFLEEGTGMPTTTSSPVAPTAVVTPNPQKTAVSTQKTGKLYGLPVFYQGLALFINKKIIADYNRANQDTPITLPSANEPLGWVDFAAMAIKLTKTQDGWLKYVTPTLGDNKTNVNKSNIQSYGTALGTGKNVFYATDLLNILMMQEGIPIVSADKNKAAFDDQNFLDPAAKVLAKYVSYSYLWDPNYESSIKAFKDGRVAMLFARSYNVQEILANPELDAYIVPLPQVQKENNSKWITDNFYWSFVVNKDTKYPDVAWDFIKFITAKENLKKFDLEVQHPTTRLDLVPDLKQNTDYDRLFGVFNSQLPYVKSIYKGKSDVFEAVFQDAIEQVNQKKDTSDITQISRQVLDQAGEKITQNLQEYPYD